MNLKKYVQPLLKFKVQSLLLGLLLALLLLFYFYKWYGGNTIADKLWEYIDPVAGIMTFVTTLAIFYVQGYQRWEDTLEKRLSVSYFAPKKGNFMEIARVEKAYLAGDGDIRAWAQSLGGQIMGNLDFDLNWDEEKIQTLQENKKWYKHYQLKIYLTTNPFESNNEKAERFKAEFKHFHHSEVIGDINNLPIVWRKKSD